MKSIIDQSRTLFLSKYMAEGKDFYKLGTYKNVTKNYTTAGDFLNRTRTYRLHTIPRNMKLRNSRERQDLESLQ